MAVKSSTISVTIEEMAYALSIEVTPTTGKVGDLFDFHGYLTLDGAPVEMQWIDLVLEETGEKVANTASGYDGYYSCLWIADRGGTLRFHTEAPHVPAASKTVTISLPVPGIWGVALILAPILVGGALIAASRW